jgi:hypothetical protein
MQFIEWKTSGTTRLTTEELMRIAAGGHATETRLVTINNR